MTCKHQPLRGHVRNSTCEHGFRKQITFPLKDTSRNICMGTHVKGRKFGICQRDVQCVFQALQRDEQTFEPWNLRVLREFMESRSKWFSLPMSSST